MKQLCKKIIYPNGLTLLVDEAPQLRSVAVAAWVKTGSRNENFSSSGICHFLEHMLFKGSKRRGALEIANAVDRVGGDFNAFTSREHTCFHFYLPSKQLPLGAELLKEILLNPLFEKKEIERERQVILQEIAMTKETPEEDSFDRYLEKCFGKHSLGRQILGTEATVSSFTRAQLFQFFYQHYRPENMLISVSGAVKFETVRRTFALLGEGQWPKRKASKVSGPQWGVDPPQEVAPGFWWVMADSEQAHVWLGFNAPIQNSKERMASILLQQYLGGGMSSVLFNEIREKKGWAYTVYGNALHFLDASLFTVYAGVKPEKISSVLSIMKRELFKIAQEGIPAIELKRVQENLLFSHALSMESSESRVMSISQAELFFKKSISQKDYRDLVCSVKGSDLQKLTQTWLKNGKFSVFVLSRKPSRKEKEGLQRMARRVTKQPIKFEREQ